jgi:hypothetical protein
MRQVFGATAIIVLIEIRAFATGCVLEFDLVTRQRTMLASGGPRIGVQLADGRKAVNGDHVLVPETAPEPPILRLRRRRFHIDDSYASLREQLWLWPLPPAEPFDLVVAWPGAGIPEVRTELDGADIVAAAESALPYWPS